LLSLAAATATAAARFPFDAVLAGMVAAGQGILAICIYLGLSHKALDDHIVRLGLRTPPDRPLRNPGPKGWSTLQTIYLIVWRVAGIHPETIAQRLSQLGPPRSANGVRAKARRLGIPRPDRKSLRKVDPATLPCPVAGLGAIADTGFPGLPTTLAPAGPGATAEAVDRRGIGPERPPASREAAAVDRPAGHPAAVRSSAAAEHERRLAPAQTSARKPIGPLVCTEQGATGWRPSNPLPQTKEEVCLSGDLTWIRQATKRLTSEAVVWTVGMLYFGGQRWTASARRMGISEGAAKTLMTRCSRPVDRDRTKFGEGFDEELAWENLQHLGLEVAKEKVSGVFFWRRKRDRASVTRSRKYRREHGQLAPYSSEEIELLTRRELDAIRGRPGMPPSSQPLRQFDQPSAIGMAA
jgi:hypothetical protein